MDMNSGTSESLDPTYYADGAINYESGDFECNICFDLAHDPIVTLCGHLYCWPCLNQWLQVHSRSHECPVCKAIIKDERLVPIYGRGKASSDPRTRLVPQIQNYSRQENEIDSVANFMQMPNERLGSLTLSSLFGAIPSLLNLRVNGFHDATVYGATTGVPYLFSSSFHGGYSHGFYYHGAPLDGTKFFLKIFLYFAGFLVIFCLFL
ncbi:unnamed protein product [Cuscuta epithymum]|uniref:E3 ubiquitin-protein ligase RMA n=1 Tax=Cuscuta epithymum TaxID=186058 RepID=A0AAV0DTF0_9ASTE|nr:unnamed protein product [Cuscuta epithymum]